MFIGIEDVKLTGNYAIDQSIVRSGGEINFTIILVGSIFCGGLIVSIYQFLKLIEDLFIKIKKKFGEINGKNK